MDRPIIPPSVICQPPSSPPSYSNMLSNTTMSYLNSTNIESLPDEQLFDILVRLPADFLHNRARLVCHRWRRIIRSNAFASTHIQQYSTYGLVLSILRSDRHKFYVTARQGRIETSELSNIRMATSCNGLALELSFNINAGGELHVMNPLTKQSFLLPTVSTHDKKHVFYYRSGIAYSPASMEYKVTLPYSNVEYKAYLDIVTVGVDKSWRHVEIPPSLKHLRSLFYDCPLSSEGGFLHWAKGRYCLTLNVETEMITMSEVPIPPHRRYLSFYYLSTGRYLSILVGRRKDFSWEVWEMKLPAESGDQWRKAILPNIDLEPQKCSLQQRFADGDERRLLPIGWVKYPEILAFCFPGLWRTCIFYNLETREINTIDLPDYSCYDYTAFVHRNSLVWLSQD